MQFGLIGSGSWATALAKILAENNQCIHWWIRSESVIKHLLHRHHNPEYLSSVYFDTSRLSLHTDVSLALQASDYIIIAIPSAFVDSTFRDMDRGAFRGKKVISAVKGILPEGNLLVNEYLKNCFDVSISEYFTLMGPCHAEEVAAEKLSYLTFSGTDTHTTAAIAQCFSTEYLNTRINNDIYGVQYAAILKNIYALGAGIAHGLDYGDNFLSVLIANSADEMAGFLRKAGVLNMEEDGHEVVNAVSGVKHANYAASVYLGDLLVTCYSLYSRNRTFGNMIGKGYSVRSAQLEMNMVAEGYNASKCIVTINKEIKAEMPIVQTIYRILWENLSPHHGFKTIEANLV